MQQCKEKLQPVCQKPLPFDHAFNTVEYCLVLREKEDDFSSYRLTKRSRNEMIDF